jgi:hypothetical protein
LSQLQQAILFIFTRQYWNIVHLILTCFFFQSGDTVADAFQKGKSGVATDPTIFDEKEAEKFLLLPKDGNHDERIFDDLPEPGRYNMCPIR